MIRKTQQKQGRNLTPREIEVIRLIAEDFANKEIAAVLNISPKTVEFHKNTIYAKLGVSGAAGVTRTAIRQGIIVP
jgi:DNA-binding NarL/FixJ family response regulator